MQWDASFISKLKNAPLLDGLDYPSLWSVSLLNKAIREAVLRYMQNAASKTSLSYSYYVD